MILGNRAVEVLQACQRVPEQNLGVDVLRIEGDRPGRAILGVLELVRADLDLAGGQLRVDVIGQQIGGANVLAVSAADIRHPQVGVGQLFAYVAAFGIDLLGETQLDHRLGQLRMGQIVVSLAKMVVGRLAARDREPETRHNRRTQHELAS